MAELLAERRVSGKAFIGHHVAAVVAGIITVAVLSVTGFAAWMPVAILPWLGVLAYTYLARLSGTYRLYPDRMEVESGLASRKIENVQLFRVRDVGLRQGLLGRLADFGDVYVHSTDSSTPDLHVRSIDAPREFYNQLRELSSESRAHHRTMIVEEGRPILEE